MIGQKIEARGSSAWGAIVYLLSGGALLVGAVVLGSIHFAVGGMLPVLVGVALWLSRTRLSDYLQREEKAFGSDHVWTFRARRRLSFWVVNRRIWAIGLAVFVCGLIIMERIREYWR